MKRKKKKAVIDPTSHFEDLNPYAAALREGSYASISEVQNKKNMAKGKGHVSQPTSPTKPLKREEPPSQPLKKSDTAKEKTTEASSKKSEKPTEPPKKATEPPKKVETKTTAEKVTEPKKK